MLIYLPEGGSYIEVVVVGGGGVIIEKKVKV